GHLEAHDLAVVERHVHSAAVGRDDGRHYVLVTAACERPQPARSLRVEQGHLALELLLGPAVLGGDCPPAGGQHDPTVGGERGRRVRNGGVPPLRQAADAIARIKVPPVHYTRDAGPVFQPLPPGTRGHRDQPAAVRRNRQRLAYVLPRMPVGLGQV